MGTPGARTRKTSPKTSSRAPSNSCIVASLIAWSLAALCNGSAVLARDIRIDHVTVVSPERSTPLVNATVYIHDDRIMLVSRFRPPQGDGRRSETATIIDGRGLYLAPGLIDGHVHVKDLPGMTPEQEQAHPEIARHARDQVPRSYLYFGFTTLVDLIASSEHIAEWNAQAMRPELYFCGVAPLLDGVPPVAVVARIRESGARCVKTFFDRGYVGANLPVPSLETMKELVEAARAAHMPVFLHANSSEAQAFGVQAGVDVITHGLWHWTGAAPATSDITPAVKSVLDSIRHSKIGWQPTLQVLHGELDLFDASYLSQSALPRVLPVDMLAWYGSSEGQWFHDVLARAPFLPKPDADPPDPAQLLDAARSFYAPLIARNRNATEYLATRNARILFGSDTPSAPTYANPPGLNGWLEMQRLVEAGLSPAQVFRAATLSNAEALGLDREIGTVQAGKRANLLLLEQDPSQSVLAYDGIVKVILQGQVIDRPRLAANRQVRWAGAQPAATPD